MNSLRLLTLKASVSIGKAKPIIISTIAKLNAVIANDAALGRGFRIGHSYFCTATPVDDMWLNAVVTYEIIPLLNEYWFDEPSKVRDWEYALREAIR